MAANCQATTALGMLIICIILVQGAFIGSSWTTYTMPVLEKVSPWGPCAEYTSCTDCNQYMTCGWCNTEKKCATGDAFGPMQTFGGDHDLSLCSNLNLTHDETVTRVQDIPPEQFAVWDTDITGTQFARPPMTLHMLIAYVAHTFGAHT